MVTQCRQCSQVRVKMIGEVDQYSVYGPVLYVLYVWPSRLVNSNEKRFSSISMCALLSELLSYVKTLTWYRRIDLKGLNSVEKLLMICC